jgi:uncharacterized membrane protein
MKNLRIIKILSLIVSIDLLWMLLVANPLYKKMILKIQGSKLRPRYQSIVVTYLLLTLGYYTFLPKRDMKKAFTLGLVSYGVYNFTSYTTLKDYDVCVGLADTIWGGVMMGLVNYFV